MTDQVPSTYKGDFPISIPVTLNAVTNLWPYIRADLKTLNPALESIVAGCSEVTVSDRGKVVLVHHDRVQCDGMLKEGNRALIAGVLSRRFGHEIEIVCVTPDKPKLTSLRDRVRAATPIPHAPIAGPGRTLVSAAPDNGAIRTTYKGVKFRSRLEARWAAFFDESGTRWEFEPEGYKLPSGFYLPDFWLPDHDRFGEVKPTADAVDIQKIEELVLFTGKRCEVLVGPPWDCQYGLFYPKTYVEKTLNRRFGPETQEIAERVRGMSFWDPS